MDVALVKEDSTCLCFLMKSNALQVFAWPFGIERRF